MIYFVFIFVLLILIFKYDFSYITEGGNVKMVFAALFCIALLAGLRYRIGTDTIIYEISYHTFPDLDHLNWNYIFSDRYAPLWCVFLAFLKSVGADFVFVQLIVSCTISFSIFYCIKAFELKHCAFTIILLYFIGPCYSLNCESLRETISLSVFLLSLPCLFKRDFKKYYIFSAIAIGFHYSAIFLLLIPISLKLRINLKTISFVLVLMLISGSLRNIVPMLNSYIYMFSFESYVDRIMESEQKVLTIGAIFAKIFVPLLCGYILKKNNKLSLLLESLLILSVIISIFTLSIYILYRYESFLLIPKFFVYGLFLGYIAESQKKYMHLVFCTFFVLFFYIEGNFWTRKLSWANSYWYELVFPYSSVFDKTVDNSRESLYWSIGR